MRKILLWAALPLSALAAPLACAGLDDHGAGSIDDTESAVRHEHHCHDGGDGHPFWHCPDGGKTSSSSSSSSSSGDGTGTSSSSSSSSSSSGDGTGASSSSSSSSGGETSPCPPSTEIDKAMWVWDGGSVTDATARAKLFAFAGAHHVTRIYLQTGAGSSVLTSNLLATKPSELASFLDEAATQCIGVDLLFGKASWTVADQHSIPISLAQQAVAFAAGLTGQKPKGVHFDIEPHGVSGVTSGGTTYSWSTTSQKPALMAQFLDLADSLAATLAGSGLELSMDVAFWLDGASQSFNPLTYKGVAKPASEHVIDIIDRAVIMDYRDSAFGTGTTAATSSDGMFDLAATEVAYARSKGKPITLGVEVTGCQTVGGSIVLTGSVPDKVTFCDEGRAVMEAELAKVAAAYAATGATPAYAVEDYAAYSDPTVLKP